MQDQRSGIQPVEEGDLVCVQGLRSAPHSGVGFGRGSGDHITKIVILDEGPSDSRPPVKQGVRADAWQSSRGHDQRKE